MLKQLITNARRSKSALHGAPRADKSRFSLSNLRSRGFTLLELMIVMTIIVILAAIVMPLYQKSVRHAREATLRDSLYQMRKAIDQYQSDKTKLPPSIQALADEKYIREVPVDPITGAKDWQEATGEDTAALGGGSGLTDVHSSSSETSSEGTPYSEW